MPNENSPLRKLVGGWFDSWWEQFVDSVLARHEVRIRSLEARMATQEEFAADLDSFTNELADEVDTVITTVDSQQSQIADLKAQLDAGNTAAVSAALDSFAPNMGRLREISAKLREAGTDPDSPIPDPLPPAPEPAPTV